MKINFIRLKGLYLLKFGEEIHGKDFAKLIYGEEKDRRYITALYKRKKYSLEEIQKVLQLLEITFEELITEYTIDEEDGK